MSEQKRKRRKKSKGGRPAWYPNLEEMVKVEHLAALGLTLDQIAEHLNIAPSTLYKAKKLFTEFSERIKKGKRKTHIVIAGKLVEDALGEGKMSQVARMFYLKTQCGWREKFQVQGDKSSPLQVAGEVRHKLSKGFAQGIVDIIAAARKQTQ